MRTRIKVCGITTRDALQACIDVGIDAVGFVFAPSPRRIDPRAAKELTNTLPSFLTSVGVFKGISPELMLAAAQQSGITVIQSDAGELAGLTWTGPILPVFRTNSDLSPALLSPSPLILIEGERSGAGVSANWAAAEPIARRRPIVLAGGLTPHTVADAIRQVRPFAVDVSSGVESSPGIKDPRLIRAFAHAVHQADRSVYGESQ